MNSTFNMKEAPNIKALRLWRNLAILFGLISFVVCILLVVNYLQLKRSDPLNAPAIQVLMDKMKNNPDDQDVKMQIRELDFLARKAFFTSQWQIRTGGYILLISLIALITCLQVISAKKVLIPEMPVPKQDDFWAGLRLNQKWVMYSGAGLVFLAVVFGVLAHNELGKTINRKLSGGREQKNVSNLPVNSVGVDSGALALQDVTAVNDSASKTTTAFPSQAEINRNFPSFRGPGGYGNSMKSNIPVSWDGSSGKNIKWKSAVPLPGNNSPVVWNTNVYLSGANQTKREIYCFNASTGKMNWKTVVDKISGSPSQVPKVTNETGFSAPTLTTDGKRVFGVFANGDMIALDTTGKKIWAKNLGLPKNHYGYASSLTMYHNLVIVQYDQTGGSAVMALDGETGNVAWKTARDVKVSWSSPILAPTASGTILILDADPFVIAYNPMTGKELWRMECITGEVGPSLAYADGVVFSVNEYSKLTAFQAGTPPKQLWENTEFLSDIPSPVANKNYLFLPTSYGTLVCYDSKTGNKYWEKDFGNPIFASPMLAEGRVYILDKKGIMHIVKADKTFSLVNESQLGEGSACTPAFMNGHVFIRGDKNLYCIGK